MLGASLICPDDQINQDLTVAAPTLVDLAIARNFTTYPASDKLLRTIRVRKVDIVLFCVNDFVLSETLAKCIDDFMPGFPDISLSSGAAVDLRQKPMHLGIGEQKKPLCATGLPSDRNCSGWPRP
jgi:hypothetical protein